MSVRFLDAVHPQLGRFYAAVDAEVRFTEPHCSTTRLGAVLAPYPDEASAREALTAVTQHGLPKDDAA